MTEKSNLFSRLGFRLTKPEVQKKLPKKISDALIKDNEERIKLYKKDTQETAEMYHSLIPNELVLKMMGANDYLCVQWGSRKVARLLNLCRNILDIEILTEGTELGEKDREHVLYLLVWACWLFPIPLKHHLKMENTNEHFLPIFKKWLIEEHNLISESEFNLVMNAVFLGVSTKPGNPVLDIFHDALRFEEAQFDMTTDEKYMRTKLGKSRTFKIKSQKDSRSNLTPHWMFEFQDLKGITGLVDKEKALKDEEYYEKDGIS